MEKYFLCLIALLGKKYLQKNNLFINFNIN